MYADDIAFQVFNKSKSFQQDQIFNFFLGWINDKPVGSKSVKARWLNVGIILNNCLAISNLTRHNVKDIENKAENKIQKFLSQTDNSMKKESAYFRNLMTNLKEDTTEELFEKADRVLDQNNKTCQVRFF